MFLSYIYVCVCEYFFVIYEREGHLFLALPDGKTTEIGCQRDWRLSATVGPIRGPPWNTSEHHGYHIEGFKGGEGASIGSPLCLSDSWCGFSSLAGVIACVFSKIFSYFIFSSYLQTSLMMANMLLIILAKLVFEILVNWPNSTGNFNDNYDIKLSVILILRLKCIVLINALKLLYLEYLIIYQNFKIVQF